VNAVNCLFLDGRVLACSDEAMIRTQMRPTAPGRIEIKDFAFDWTKTQEERRLARVASSFHRCERIQYLLTLSSAATSSTPTNWLKTTHLDFALLLVIALISYKSRTTLIRPLLSHSRNLSKFSRSVQSLLYLRARQNADLCRS
jgi:hypothetical protein